LKLDGGDTALSLTTSRLFPSFSDFRFSSQAGRAFRARAVKHQLVPANAKLTASEVIDSRGTPAQLEHPCALVADKMVMVCLPRPLVDGDRARKVQSGKPTFLHEAFDVAVNGGDSQPLRALLCHLKNLEGRKWTVGVLESRPDG
jgi:hypothetical protein